MKNTPKVFNRWRGYPKKVKGLRGTVWASKAIIAARMVNMKKGARTDLQSSANLRKVRSSGQLADRYYNQKQPNLRDVEGYEEGEYNT